MNGLFYLFWRSSVNFLKETLHKPARLIPYVVLIVFFCGILLVSILGSEVNPRNSPDVRIIGGLFFAFMLQYLGLCLGRAFGSGSSLFLMSDVNLLFVSPVPPQKILLYGVIKFFKNTILSSVFILFQGMIFKTMFGISFPALLLIVGIYVLCSFLLELLAMLLYGATSGNQKRQRVVKVLIAIAFLPLVITIGVEISRMKSFMAALPNIFDSLSYQAFPILGWGAAAMVEFIGGNHSTGWLFLALILIATAWLFIMLLKLKTNYYENVLAAAESAFERKQALAEGNINAIQSPARKIQVSTIGLSGFGARALFGKHMRETFRKSRFGFFDLQTLFFVTGTIIFAFVKRNDPDNQIFTILQILCVLQLFTIGLGPGLRELLLHYIYLLPASSFSKIVWNNLSIVIKSCLDAVLIFGLAGMILHENPLVIIGAILAYTLFALLLIGVNVLSLRWTDVNISSGILFSLYIFAIAIVMMPGLVAAFVIDSNIGGIAGTVAALGMVCFWETLIALICFALSKGILDNCDMPVVKMTK